MTTADLKAQMDAAYLACEQIREQHGRMSDEYAEASRTYYAAFKAYMKASEPVYREVVVAHDSVEDEPAEYEVRLESDYTTDIVDTFGEDRESAIACAKSVGASRGLPVYELDAEDHKTLIAA